MEQSSPQSSLESLPSQPSSQMLPREHESLSSQSSSQMLPQEYEHRHLDQDSFDRYDCFPLDLPEIQMLNSKYGFMFSQQFDLHCINWAFDNTFVLLVTYKDHGSFIEHMNTQGKVIYVRKIDDFERQQIMKPKIAMLRNDQIIVPFLKRGYLMIISLRTFEEQIIQIQKLENGCIYSDFFVFPESDLICVCHKIYRDHPRRREYEIIIKYFKYGGSHSKSKSIYNYTKKYNDCYPGQRKIRKLNNYSLVGWRTEESLGGYETSFNEVHHIHTIISIDSNMLGKVQNFYCQQQINVLWHLRDQYFMIQYLTIGLGYVQFNRQTSKVNIQKSYPICCQDFGDYIWWSIQRCFAHANILLFLIIEQATNSYIWVKIKLDGNFETQLVDVQKKLRLARPSYIQCDWNPRYIVQIEDTNINKQYRKRQVQQQYKWVKTFVQFRLIDTLYNTKMMKDIYMLFLENINEDFDQDLLQDAIELLEEE